MPSFKHGRNAVILFNSTNLSPYLHESGLEVEVDNADSSTFGNTWHTNMAGMAGATLTFDGYQDAALDTVLQAALRVNAGVLTYAPGGAATAGDPVRLVSVTATSLSEAPSIDAVSPFSWAVAAQAQVGFGAMIHPLAEDTNTTTGSAINQTAQTTSGWFANLHVTAIDAGGRSWVITIEDSSTGSSGWAVIATFTAATTVTQQRLASAATTTTVKQYVRVVATASGGSAGQGITYALAFARGRVQ